MSLARTSLAWGLLATAAFSQDTPQQRARQSYDRAMSETNTQRKESLLNDSISAYKTFAAYYALGNLQLDEHRYKDAAKQLIRKRYQTLYSHMGVPALRDSKDVNYYSLIDLQEIGGILYGPDFKAWFVKSDLGINFLFRLADETGVVLLPGNGFEVVDTSARVSLANLTEVEYAAIGKFTRQILEECHQDFKKTVVLQ